MKFCLVAARSFWLQVERKVQSCTLKGVPNHFFAQAFRKLVNTESHSYDRKFTFEGMVATLDEDVFDTTIQDSVDE